MASCAHPAARPPVAPCRWPAGAALAALGSDTGGSIRIPAALQGLVGFKNTQRLTPLEGTVPLSTTLDTVCAITRDVTDAVLMHEILAQRHVTLGHAPARRLAFGRAAHAAARRARRHRGCCVRARAAGAARARRAHRRHRAARTRRGRRHQRRRRFRRRRELGLAPQAPGRARRRLRPARGDAHPSRRDHERGRLHRPAARASALDRRMADAMRGFDAMLSPTVPIVAPEIAPLVASDEAFFARQRRAAAQPVDGQPARWLRAVAALPPRRTSCRWA